MAHVYLSGPMTGLPEFNVPAFMAAALRLRTEGHEVFNPAESFGGRLDLPRDEYFRKDFEELVRVANNGGYVVVLPGWEKSRGATLEVLAAAEMGIRVMTLDGEPVAAPPQHQVCQATQERMVSGEVRITDPRTGGQKGQKPIQFHTIPPEFLMEVGRVYFAGAQKYAARNFERGYKWSLSFDAMMRHLWAWWGGEEIDPESGCNHMAHGIWHCFQLMLLAKYHRDLDDRSDLYAKTRDVQTNTQG